MKNKVKDYVYTLTNNDFVNEILHKIFKEIFLKQNNFDDFIKENHQKIIHIRDWVISIVENNEQWKSPRVLTLDALNNAANKYFEKKNNKLQTIELDEKHEKHEKLIADLGDYYVVQMLTSEALDNESKVMQHCIGHGWYDKYLENKDFYYFSLRDKYNKAHVTLEIIKGFVWQMQGKQNEIPDFKYLKNLLPWVMKSYKIDLNLYKLVVNKKDNQIYSYYDIPDNCEIDGNLDFSSEEKEINLPNNLIVNNLHLGFTKIKRLPDNLTVKGSLNLKFCKNLKEIPEDIKIFNNLYISNSSIEKLPNNLIINGDLDLFESKIIELPKNIKCKNINIDSKQISLIHNELDFENVSLYGLSYTKEDFFSKRDFKK